MNLYLVLHTLSLYIQLVMPLVGVTFAAGLIIGWLQSALRIEDPAISFAGRLLGIVGLFFMLQSYYAQVILEFARRLWGGKDYFL
jgi:type III secretory pathway component EscS